MSAPDRIKLTVEVREDQALALRRLIPWGTQRAFFEAVIDDVITALERHGTIAIAAVLDHRLRPAETMAVLEALTRERTP